MRNKLFLIALLLVIGYSCNSAGNDRQNMNGDSTPQGFDSCMMIPRIIDSLGYRELYDSVKWNVYIRNCLDTPKDIYGQYLLPTPKSFASYCLKLEEFSINSNPDKKIKIEFAYYINGEKFIPYNYEYYTVWLPVGLLLDTVDTFTLNYNVNYFWIYDNTRSSLNAIGSIYSIPPEAYDTITDRSFKPLQPDVIVYLNKHKKEIHPWLYKEAVRRGIIKEDRD